LPVQPTGTLLLSSTTATHSANGGKSRSNCSSPRSFYQQRFAALPREVLTRACWHSDLTHQIAFLAPIIGREQAGLAVGLTAAGAMAGRLVLGNLASRVDLRAITAALLLSQAASLFAMTQTANVTALLSASAMVGVGAGPVAALPSMIVQQEFNKASFGLVIGLATAVSQFTYAFDGYLIKLVAARLRGSKKRTHRAALGTTANWAFCKLRGLLIGDFVGSKPQHGTAWAEHGRRHGGGLGGCLWVEGGSTSLSWL
jgi:MFS family permease